VHGVCYTALYAVVSGGNNVVLILCNRPVDGYAGHISQAPPVRQANVAGEAIPPAKVVV